MKTINLLPREIIQRDELNKFLIKLAAVWAVIFFCLVLLVFALNQSIWNAEETLAHYTEMASDEKYIESDLIAESSRGIRSDVSKLIGDEKINLGIIAFVAESAVQAQTVDGNDFLYINEILYEYGRIEIIGVASNQTLISSFALTLRDERIFSDIEIPSITRASGFNNFRLTLKIKTGIG